jgi:hypothetical protein
MGYDDGGTVWAGRGRTFQDCIDSVEKQWRTTCAMNKAQHLLSLPGSLFEHCAVTLVHLKTGRKNR